MVQTILGSNGQIGREIAETLFNDYTKNIRLVSRNPTKLHDTDEVMSADLTDYKMTYDAILGSEIVYFAVGLPYSLWQTQFELILENVIQACITTGAKLVYFDNTYMYPKNSDEQIETIEFAPNGTKSEIRAKMTERLIRAMNDENLEALIGRAPEFYGPDDTQSITNTLVFNRIKEDKKVLIPISATKLRTLIWTPDASRALVLLAQNPSSYGQTWHLPTAESITYKALLQKIDTITGKAHKFVTIPMWVFKLASLVNSNAKELMELLPRYQEDNVFKSDKFKQEFPNFQVTSFDEGIEKILSPK